MPTAPTPLLPMDPSRLPIELCEYIMDYAALTPPGEISLVDYDTIRTCALVCHAWLPRARANLFYRVVLRSSTGLHRFLSAVRSGGGARIRELELTLPLAVLNGVSRGRGNDDGASNVRHPTPEQASIASPEFGQAVSAVKTLALSCSRWLYPRTYSTIFASHFASVTTLDLFQTYFSTGGDFTRLVWSFPQLAALECVEAIVEYGATRALGKQLPTPTSRAPGCPGLRRLVADSCSSTTPYLIRVATFGVPPIEDVFVRSSFARWDPDDYQSLSAFSTVQRLSITFASPTTFSPLSPKLSLIALYREAVHHILAHLASGRSHARAQEARGHVSVHDHAARRDTLGSLVFAFEPGHGPWKVLCGEDRVEEREDRKWTYEGSRSAALDAWFAELEADLLDATSASSRAPPSLKHPFSALRLVWVRIWDADDGAPDAWWAAEVAKRLPTLQAAGMLRLEIVRYWHEGIMHSSTLWHMEQDPSGT